MGGSEDGMQIDGRRFLRLSGGQLLAAAALSSALGALACSGTPANNGFANDGGQSLNNGTGPGSSGGEGGALRAPDGALTGLTDADTTSGDCPASAKLVYVTGSGSNLWSFLPAAPGGQLPGAFHLIGKFSCLDGPTHMTVDRQGNAWVVANGNIYKASTADATCSAVTNWKPEPANFPDFALTFVGTTSAVDNTLYMLSDSTGNLGKFDLVAGALTVIGQPNVPSTGGDMTTNGDGTLYFLMDVTMPQLFELDPTNASVLKTYPINAMGGGDQALAFYGGSFYAFENDVISVYDPKAGTTTAGGKAPLMVTGAGQSTCVPLVPTTAK
jgi:hypothetical protein